MERFVARANITHFLNLLKCATNPEERRIIEGFLAEEEQKLKEAEARAAPGGAMPKPEPPKLRDAAE
jgi:hypothetical protein